MSPPLAASLLQHAEEMPEEPWLFFRPKLGVRWRSFRQVAEQVAAGAAILAHREPGRLAFAWRVEPDGVAMDLAAAAAGHTAVPCSPEEVAEAVDEAQPTALARRAAAEGCAAWAVIGDPEAVPADFPSQGGASREIPRLELPPAPSKYGRSTRPLALPSCPPGTVDCGGEALDSGRLVNQVGQAFAPLAAAAERDVLVLGGDLASLPQRLLLSWATLAGAAVVLEPYTAGYRHLVRWARPTVLAGTAEEIAAWRRETRRPRIRAKAAFRPPFDRVRAVAVLGEEPLDAEDLTFWPEAGAVLLHLPDRPSRLGNPPGAMV